MKLKLNDDEVRAALTEYVVKHYTLEGTESQVTVVRVTRHNHGTASADIELEPTPDE